MFEKHKKVVMPEDFGISSGELQKARYYAEYLVDERLNRLLSLPSLMRACDALGAPTTGEYCELLRRALLEA